MWAETKGTKIPFVYEDITGEFEILEYDKKMSSVLCQYNKNKCYIRCSSILYGKIGGLFSLKNQGKRKQDFKYIVYQRINNKEILQRKRIYNKGKFYKVQCLIDGYQWWQKEDRVEKQGCPICKGLKIHPEINSIKITHPSVYNVVLHKNKDYLGCNKNIKVDWICKTCGCINNNNLVYLCKLSDRLPCVFCGDKTSYPEKILYSAMEQITDNFERHKSFEWSNRRMYDGFDNKKHIYVEIHGEQHYEKTFESCGGRTLEEEIKNDRYKEFLAKMHDEKIVDYIVIDARYSDFDYISNNIRNSKLCNYYDMWKINWDRVKKETTKSIIKECSDLYNKGYNINEICQVLKVSNMSVYTYLKRGTKLGMCNFIPNKTPNKGKVAANADMVICLNNKKIFNSKSEAKEYAGLKSCTSITNCCNGKTKFAGKDPISGENLKWELYIEYLEKCV